MTHTSGLRCAPPELSCRIECFLCECVFLQQINAKPCAAIECSRLTRKRTPSMTATSARYFAYIKYTHMDTIFLVSVYDAGTICATRYKPHQYHVYLCLHTLRYTHLHIRHKYDTHTQHNRQHDRRSLRKCALLSARAHFNDRFHLERV